MAEKIVLTEENSKMQFSCAKCHSTNFRTIGEKDGFIISQCGDCDLTQVQNMPNAQFLADFYENYHGNANKLKHHKRKQGLWFRKLWPLFLYANLRNISGNKNYLDVGCNIGFSVSAAYKHGWNGFGIDMSGDAIETARKLYPNCNFSAGDFNDAGFENGFFNFITASEVIEHVTNPNEFAKQISQLLHKGGLLYITTPDRGAFKDDISLIAWKEVCPPHHLLFFTQKTLTDLFAQYGLKPISRFPVFKPNIRMVFEKV